MYIFKTLYWHPYAEPTCLYLWPDMATSCCLGGETGGVGADPVESLETTGFSGSFSVGFLCRRKKADTPAPIRITTNNRRAIRDLVVVFIY